MNEELMVQILVMGGVVATLVLGIAALIKVLKLASTQHRDRLARHQRAQEQLQLDADARGMAVRSEAPEHSLGPTQRCIAEGTRHGVTLRLEQGWRVKAAKHVHTFPRARVVVALLPASAGLLEIAPERIVSSAKLLGTPDLLCGDAKLDARYRFQSSQPERAQPVLQNASYQEALRRLTALPGEWELSFDQATVTAESISEDVPDFGGVADGLVQYARALDGACQAAGTGS